MSEKTYTSNIPGQPNYSNWNQFVLTRTNMTDPFTDDEYNSCIEALDKHNAVAVSFGTGTVRQAQLVSKTNLGALTFSYTRNEKVESYTIAASSPHNITTESYDVDNSITPIVTTGTKIAEGNINGQQFELFAPSGGGGSGDQFVLVRSNMTTDFTNAEYQDCIDAVTAEQAVCVQFVMTGSTIQAQLTTITGGGTLVFEFTSENYHFRWEVASTNNAHSIELKGNIFGVPIFDTLQDAIANEYTLKSGDIFETNGFYTIGDGGAARYLVSSTGTANGMDIITLAAGKYALFQWSNEVTPEQLGAVGDGSTDDTTVFDYIINYFSSVLGDMQVKRTIRGSMSKRYKVNALYVHDVCVSQCVLRGSGSTTGYGIKLGSRAIIEKCILFDFINAIYTDDGDSAISAVVTGCTISWCGNGIALQSGTSQAISVDNILLENNYISRLGTLGHSTNDTPPNWDNTGCGIWLNGNWKNVNIVNNVLEYNGYAGLRLQCDRTDLEPSCTVTENYFEGNKFSAIRILMQKRPCAVSIFGNQMTKLDTNVFFTTGIYCSSAVMSSGRIESPYGEYLGVVTSNNGSDVLSVNTENLRASNVSIYPGALTAKTFQLIPAKCANSRYASRQMLHIDLYVRSPDPSFTMTVSYVDRNNNAQTTSVSLTPNRHEVIEIPLIDVNLYDSTNYPVTCVVTSADGWFYIMITDMWIK